MRLKWIICVAVLTIFPVQVVSKDVLRIRNSDEFIPCEKGWYVFGEKCYKVFGKKTTGKMSFDNAETACKNVGGNLVSIHSEKEKDFILSFLLMEVKATVWIGLHDKENESNYVWTDGSEFNYANWNEWEPSGLVRDYEDCIELMFAPESDYLAEFNDASCNSELPFICQMSINSKRISPNPAYCASDVGGGWKQFDVGGGFKHKSSCYYVVSDKKSWDNAEQYCVDTFNGHLVTVLDITLDRFMDQLYPNKYFWIGIKIKDQLQQKWASGWHVSYSRIHKEHGDFIEGTCVRRKNRTMWTMLPCASTYPFICEVSEVKPPVLELSTEGSHCPSELADWRDLDGDYCYYFETKTARTWYEANFDCMRRGGNLVKLHSEEETRILFPFVRYTSFKWAHIGLFRPLANEHHFVWIDGSNTSGYDNWDHGEPSNEQQKCVQVYTRDWLAIMAWYDDRGCAEAEGYICSVKKIAPNITIIEEPSDCSGHISFKALIGVSICIILVIILLGVVVYYFRRWDGERRKNSTQMPCSTPSPRDRPRYRLPMELKVKEDEDNYEVMH